VSFSLRGRMKTVVLDTKNITRAWHLVDATGVPLGRLASNVACLLIGKHKPSFAPNQDHGDYVVVINAEKVKLTGNKINTETFFRHSRYPGGGKFRTLKEQMQRDPAWVVNTAVRGMVNRKTVLGRNMLRKLHVYRDGTHPHAAQNPQPMDIKAK
jgi:large subunit ribosomal protein L13